LPQNLTSDELLAPAGKVLDIESLAGIRLVAFDVDGVLTDGRFYLSNDGVESKAFSTQDGYGIRCLIQAGITVVVISGRSSVAVDMRMQDLGVEHVFQGCKDKVAVFENLTATLGIKADECAFVGDDIPDLALLQKVGYSVAVANAVGTVREQCDYTTLADGGYGAVREVCDLIITAQEATR
jgi:3-deoxy-D-manno-octulosonate 8-phosphate phosphatase (KDO 8-P phosphatase)